MEVRKQVELIQNSRRMRILRSGKVLFEGFGHMVNGTSGSLEKIGLSGEEEVKTIGIHTETRHKRWKELGLMEDVKENEVPDYESKDLQTKIYLDIELKE